MCNSPDHAYPYTHGGENHQQQSIRNALRRREAAETPGVPPALSNAHISMIGEREPKYFTVRERRKLQFISISCALGQ